jgi:hypothetical protein
MGLKTVLMVFGAALLATVLLTAAQPDTFDGTGTGRQPSAGARPESDS